MDIREELLKFRVLNNMTQKEFCEKYNFSIATIVAVEKGKKVTNTTAMRIKLIVCN